MKDLNFVAVDFETMTPDLSSACAIGLVKVKNGVITQKFYSLINPIPDDRLERNTHVHGITDDMVKHAPTIEELWPSIVAFVNNDLLVCHNSSTDMNVFRECMRYCGLHGINTGKYADTFLLYGKSLEQCCKEHGILLEKHHDALADAEACAKLYLCYHGAVSSDLAHYSLRDIMANKESRSYRRETLVPLPDEDVKNKNTVFYNKKVVITGVLDSFPDRDKLGETLKSFGADINTAVSSKTNIVIVGNGAGPSKMKKIEGLRAAGKDIRLIFEDELCMIMDEILV